MPTELPAPAWAASVPPWTLELQHIFAPEVPKHFPRIFLLRFGLLDSGRPQLAPDGLCVRLPGPTDSKYLKLRANKLFEARRIGGIRVALLSFVLILSLGPFSTIATAF